jgi:hypothetical protein
MQDNLKSLKEQFAALNEVLYIQLHLYNKLNDELVQKLEKIKKQIDEIEKGEKMR